MRIRRPAALAAGLLVVIFPVLAGGAFAGGGGAASAAAAKHEATVAYWTPERLRAAIPRDFVRDAQGFHLQPQKGKPGGGGGGGGGNGLSNTSGASWTNGTGKVYTVTGKVYSFLFQYSLSVGQLLWHPQAFWGQGPDLIITPYLMYNHVNIDNNAVGTDATFDQKNKLKFGVEATYMGLDWLGAGFRFDSVQPDLDQSDLNFSVFSPRLIFRTAFVTHEQIMVQYSRYFTGSAVRGQFPYNMQPGGGGLTATDKNAAQIAAIIWF